MSEVQAPKRLAKVATELNQSKDTILEFLKSKGFNVENNPNAKLDSEQYNVLVKEFQADKSLKEQAEKELNRLKKDIGAPVVVEQPVVVAPVKIAADLESVKVVKPEQPVAKKEEEVIKAKAEKIGVKQKGTIDLEALNQKTKPGKKSKKKEEVTEEPKVEVVTPLVEAVDEVPVAVEVQ